MPEKRYKRGCGRECLRCWQNNLIHGNPTACKYVIKNDCDYDIIKPENDQIREVIDITIDIKSTDTVNSIIKAFESEVSRSFKPVSGSWWRNLYYQGTELTDRCRRLKYYKIYPEDNPVLSFENYNIHLFFIDN